MHVDLVSDFITVSFLVALGRFFAKQGEHVNFVGNEINDIERLLKSKEHHEVINTFHLRKRFNALVTRPYCGNLHRKRLELYT